MALCLSVMLVTSDKVPRRITLTFTRPLLASSSSCFHIMNTVVKFKGANLLLKVGDTKLKVHVEGATIRRLSLAD